MSALAYSCALKCKEKEGLAASPREQRHLSFHPCISVRRNCVIHMAGKEGGGVGGRVRGQEGERGEGGRREGGKKEDIKEGGKKKISGN